MKNSYKTINNITKTPKISKWKHNVFIEEINKITLSWNDEKAMQSICSLEIYAYGKSKYLVSEKKRLNVTM